MLRKFVAKTDWKSRVRRFSSPEPTLEFDCYYSENDVLVDDRSDSEYRAVMTYPVCTAPPPDQASEQTEDLTPDQASDHAPVRASRRCWRTVAVALLLLMPLLAAIAYVLVLVQPFADPVGGCGGG